MPNQPRPLPIPDPTYETVNGEHETAEAEVVTEPKPLPTPSPTFEKQEGDFGTSSAETITNPKRKEQAPTYAEIPEYEGAYNIVENGTIACGGKEMITDLVINVQPKGLTTATFTANGNYSPEDYDGYSSVVVAIPTYNGSYSVTENATLSTKNKLMTDDLTVNVPSTNTLKRLLDATKTANYLFNDYKGNNIADLISYGDTSLVTTAERMFQSCTQATSIPLLDTSNVTNMNRMFYNCNALTSLPNFNTSNVTSMNLFAAYCNALTSLPNFNTSKVTNLSEAFRDCTNLTEIPSFDLSAATNLGYAFSNLPNLTAFHATGMKSSFSLYESTLLSESALVEIIGNLADLAGQTTQTLTLGATNLAKLTQAEIDQATAKNWTLA